MKDAQFTSDGLDRFITTKTLF